METKNQQGRLESCATGFSEFYGQNAQYSGLEGTHSELFRRSSPVKKLVRRPAGIAKKKRGAWAHVRMYSPSSSGSNIACGDAIGLGSNKRY